MRQGLHHLDRLQSTQSWSRPLDQPGQPAEQVEVAGKGAGDPWAQHLDRDLAPVAGHGKMDLRDRGRGDRGVVERREETVERPGEFGLDQTARLIPGERRQAILQAREILGDLVAQQIGAGRQDLSELDEARPHLGQRRGQPLARPGGGGAAAPDQPGRAQQWRGAGKAIADGRGREQRVVPRQRQADPDETNEVATAAEKPEHPRTLRARDQSRQAEWSAAMPPVRLRNRARSSPAAEIRSRSAPCGGNRRILSTR